MPIEEINEPWYWHERLGRAQKSGRLHEAVFICAEKQWSLINQSHRRILAEHIQPDDSVLDCGCGWGRLIDLMPDTWTGEYRGVDLSTEFIEMAHERYGHSLKHRVSFSVGTLEEFYSPTGYDWGILVSMRPMIVRHQGGEVWEAIEKNLQQHCNKLLYLEYDPDDKGAIE